MSDQLPPARPRWATPRTPARRTFGPAVAHLSAALGRVPMPWQRETFDVALEVVDDPDSPRGWAWAYRVVIVTVPRQAGKTTGLIAPVGLHGALTDERPSWLTAQTRQHARDTWGEIARDVARSPLAELVRARRSNGSEGLYVDGGGGAFRVFAPTEDALHGTTNARVFVDEAWKFDAARGAALEQAILPTFTTTGGQLWIVSTAGTADSGWLRALVERGRDAVDTGRRDTVCHVEYGVDEDAAAVVEAGLAEGATAADRDRAFEVILAQHPARGFTLRRDALEQAASTMSAGDVLRAYGNAWTRTAERVIPEHLWNARRADRWERPDGELALAFEVALDRRDACIVASWVGTDGRVRVDVVDAHPGTSWVVPRLRELVRTWRPVAVGYDQRGPAVDIADELARGGISLTPTTSSEYAAACVGFLADVVDGRLEHPGADALDAAVAAAAQRPLGDAWAWARRLSAGSIAPLVAATVARWAVLHRPARRPQAIVVSRRRAA